jgi:hypothetical protein
MVPRGIKKPAIKLAGTGEVGQGIIFTTVANIACIFCASIYTKNTAAQIVSQPLERAVK